jgi:predicted DNA-binding transcriptional regulator YafY
MRADRLISIVMLLQSHERMTAEELSDELEVSTRTIYRDVMALNMAGIPIYTDRGPGGGIALLDSYRTTLTGMNEDETRALFMMSIPQSLVDLGVGQNLKSALYKLAAALPRHQIEQAYRKELIHRINTPETADAPRSTETLHRALWMDRIPSAVSRSLYPGRTRKYSDWCQNEQLVFIRKVDGFIKVLCTKSLCVCHQKLFVQMRSNLAEAQ